MASASKPAKPGRKPARVRGLRYARLHREIRAYLAFWSIVKGDNSK